VTAVRVVVVEDSPVQWAHLVDVLQAERDTPILVLSARVTRAGSAAAVESLLAGAVEALPKPERWDAEAERQVRCRVRLLSGVTVVSHPRGRRRPPAPDPYRAPPVAIAASTGGRPRWPRSCPAWAGWPRPSWSSSTSTRNWSTASSAGCSGCRHCPWWWPPMATGRSRESCTPPRPALT
jgi:hypothetical protein